MTDTELTLETAAQMVRQAEDIAQQIAHQEVQTAACSVQEVSHRRFDWRRSTRTARERNDRVKERNTRWDNTQDSNRCGKCGKAQHRESARCPAEDSKCRKCRKRGHWEIMCHSRKAELQRMEEHGVIERVMLPTDWCAPMVPVMKATGKVRICVGLNKLNDNIKRERYMLPTTEEILAKFTGATVFTSLDAESGFWQIPLHEESSLLTTFMTPFRRFCFKRLPFGISIIPEIFQHKMNELLDGLEQRFPTWGPRPP
ncbi:hypothetical protein SKAU_G00413080 [Synaphobranchus kaupii]|uniref:Reverse transcriptase domain-containing protein n=1 Tax=Synaphobranchus kaupii TaxID=118154 RepID=A0A9Q1IBW6_SYNKA|nr:hypothetical protein SKAU_G00413080 [Synaphobranchus kaupii]